MIMTIVSRLRLYRQCTASSIIVLRATTMNVLQVAPQADLVLEEHATVSALMGLIPCVQIEVVLQRSLLGKCLVAQRASERLDPGVRTYVADQVDPLGKTLPTDQTQVLSVRLQVAQVALQVLEDSVTPPAQVRPLTRCAVRAFLQLISRQTKALWQIFSRDGKQMGVPRLATFLRLSFEQEQFSLFALSFLGVLLLVLDIAHRFFASSRA